MKEKIKKLDEYDLAILIIAFILLILTIFSFIFDNKLLLLQISILNILGGVLILIINYRHQRKIRFIES